MLGGCGMQLGVGDFTLSLHTLAGVTNRCDLVTSGMDMAKFPRHTGENSLARVLRLGKSGTFELYCSGPILLISER